MQLALAQPRLSTRYRYLGGQDKHLREVAPKTLTETLPPFLTVEGPGVVSRHGHGHPAPPGDSGLIRRGVLWEI